jgi:hypothetical protein
LVGASESLEVELIGASEAVEVGFDRRGRDTRRRVGRSSEAVEVELTDVSGAHEVGLVGASESLEVELIDANEAHEVGLVVAIESRARSRIDRRGRGTRRGELIVARPPLEVEMVVLPVGWNHPKSPAIRGLRSLHLGPDVMVDVGESPRVIVAIIKLVPNTGNRCWRGDGPCERTLLVVGFLASQLVSLIIGSATSCRRHDGLFLDLWSHG